MKEMNETFNERYNYIQSKKLKRCHILHCDRKLKIDACGNKKSSAAQI